MADLHSTSVIFKLGSKSLSKLLALGEGTPEEWQTDDLAAMVRHQLVAPLKTDLRPEQLAKNQFKELPQVLRRNTAIGILSFRDLLFHRDPPLELLRLSKEFFKQKFTDHKKDSAEGKVAFLFYLLFILAAKRHHQNISKLPPGRILEFSGWALRQDWVDPTLKELLAQSGRQQQAKT